MMSAMAGGKFVAFFLTNVLLFRATSGSVPPGCQGEINLVFLLDSSESVKESGGPLNDPLYAWHSMLSFVQSLVQNLPIDASYTTVATIRYATTAEVLFNFNFAQTITTAAVIAALSGANATNGNTNTAAALSAVSSQVFKFSSGFRSSARKVIVVFTDGLSTVDGDETVLAAASLKGGSAEIFTVGVGTELNVDALNSIASSPATKYVQIVDDYPGLVEIVERTVNRICNLTDEQPTVHPGCPENCQVCLSDSTCGTCVNGYYWDPIYLLCRGCNEQADIAFIFDSSGSINYENSNNYQRILNFSINIVKRLNIGPTEIRVALEVFSSGSDVSFYLNNYTDRDSIIAAINRAPYYNGETDTQGALSDVRNLIFQPQRGDRPDVRNVVILITDGASNVQPKQTIPQALLLKQFATVFVVGITMLVNVGELEAIASAPINQHCWRTPSESTLNDLLVDLVRFVCSPTKDSYNGVDTSKCN